MNYTFFFDDYLYDLLLKAKKEKKIKDFKTWNQPPLEIELESLNKLDAVHQGIEEYYEKRSDGFELEWWCDKEKSIGGKMNLAETKYLFADMKEYYDEEILSIHGEDLKYFQPFDYCSNESRCGFIIRPNSIEKSMYYKSIDDYELDYLDLDYYGYTQMAIEARVFYNWQVVLLYYMNGVGIGSVETETFKTEMPKIFPDWTWENFIAKFESLRLSNKNK
ncbi:hypothetical protein [Chryseobacterium gambrini]|uniref:hypothetical protein n=1 Tax=Chryseobacterium gambrini TaxID=373672 RepID=UPI0022F3F0FD|nr:hypothetical protein [Chryseobacterium gambrini]WBX98242.1 hypothetical protein PE065_03055 [Chryseobacterium gambrini]